MTIQFTEPHTNPETHISKIWVYDEGKHVYTLFKKGNSEWGLYEKHYYPDEYNRHHYPDRNFQPILTDQNLDQAKDKTLKYHRGN